MFKMGYSQYPIQQFIGADSAVVTSKGGLQGRLINQVFADTAAANSQRIRQYPGAMIYAGGKMWVRNTTATGWTELAYGPISTTNIYNSDGTLTGNRELDGNSNNLTFTAVRKFSLSGDSLDYLLDPAGNLRIGLGNQQFIMRGDTASLSRRLSYTGNLGSSFTKHSLIDKNYVDSVASLAAGTVTSVATNNGTGITGGTITSTGTLAIDTLLISTRAWRQKGIDSVTSLINARPSGSGTTNYLSKWTSSSALGNSLVFDNGTSVGVNTATPSASYKLDVNGSIYIRNFSAGGLFGGASNSEYIVLATAANAVSGVFQWTNTATYLRGGTSSDLSLGSNNTNDRMIIKSGGNVLIGTTTDAGYKLDVNGTARVSGTELRLDNGTTGTINLYSATPSIQFFSGDPTGYRLYRSSTTMILNSGGTINLHISGNNAYSLDAANGHVWRTATSGGAALARLTTGGNLMVGTTTDVASAILQATSTTKGFLPPRMTNAQMVAIATPAAGLMVYDTTNNKLNVYDGTNWVAVH